MTESPSHAVRLQQARHDRDGARLSRPFRRRRDPALLRSRLRLLFFALLVTAALALHGPVATLPAVGGVLIGVLSVAMARFQGRRLALTFVVLDWLLLGCTLAMTGGVHSWLLAGVPLLTAAHLGVSPRHETAYLLAPSLVLFIVVAIADPTLGGSRLVGSGLVLLLVAGGVIAGRRLSKTRGRRVPAPRLDAATGCYAAGRLPEMAAVRLDGAAAEGVPLGLVYVRLQHFEDSRSFLGAAGSEALIKGVAQHLRSRLTQRDVAFRLPPDAFAVLLPGRTLEESREIAALLAQEVAGHPISGRRQAVATGVAEFPAAGSVEELLSVARAEAQPAALSAHAPAPAVRVATAH